MYACIYIYTRRTGGGLKPPLSSTLRACDPRELTAKTAEQKPKTSELKPKPPEAKAKTTEPKPKTSELKSRILLIELKAKTSELKPRRRSGQDPGASLCFDLPVVLPSCIACCFVFCSAFRCPAGLKNRPPEGRKSTPGASRMSSWRLPGRSGAPGGPKVGAGSAPERSWGRPGGPKTPWPRPGAPPGRKGERFQGPEGRPGDTPIVIPV